MSYQLASSVSSPTPNGLWFEGSSGCVENIGKGVSLDVGKTLGYSGPDEDTHRGEQADLADIRGSKVSSTQGRILEPRQEHPMMPRSWVTTHLNKT